jgi:hypothetical protein
MNIAVGIVTTTGREDVLARTLESLNNETEIHIYKDAGKGLYLNNVYAERDLFKKSNVAIILEDDILACRNWYKTCQLFESYFKLVPYFKFYSLYSKGRPFKKIHGDNCYFFENGLWDQARMVRKSIHREIQRLVTPELLEKHKISKRPGDVHHDSLIKDVLNKMKIKQMYVYPPFFQHQDCVSTLGNPRLWMGKPRSSESFLGESVDSYEYFKEKLR